MRLCQTFANNLSANIKLSNTQQYKIKQPENFLERLLRPLFLELVCFSLAKSILMSIGLTAAISATDAVMTGLIIWNAEMDDFIKIVKSPEESRLLIYVVSETIKTINEWT